MIRVLILAEILVYRDGLAQCLARVDGIDVVATASSWSEGRGLVDELRPDVLLVDIEMPECIGAIRLMTSGRPSLKVVALAVDEADDVVIACAEAGVAGYIARNQSLDDVIDAIRRVSHGEAPCSARIAAALLRRVNALAGPPAASTERLTAREAQVVELIDRGLTNREIALSLCIEVATVKNHVHNILEKLNVSRRMDAVALMRGERRLGALPAHRPHA
jgi:DNA-binding NarL/FixJ family response regulator